MADPFFELYKKLQEVTDKMFEAAGDDKTKKKKVIAAKVKGYRLAHKLTQEDLAQKIGVTKTEIIRWEGEKNMPSQMAQKNMRKEGIL